jgi:glycosyltransferase involved in cell wall biosynthesis
MRVLLSAFQCSPGRGSEPGVGWHWATALADLGHDVTVITSSMFRDAILEAGPQGIDFRFVDLPVSPLRRFSPQLQMYDVYRRWQDAALSCSEGLADHHDVAHHVTWGSLRLGSRLWRLPVPLVYGPIGGGQMSPSNYWRYFGSGWPAERLRGASGGTLLMLNGRSRETMRHAAVTLVTNSATAAACQRLGSADVRYMLADGLPPEWLVPPRTQPADVPVVLWAGRLIALKAPALALEAFAELRKTTPARLVIAGDGPMLGHLRKTVEHLGLSGHVALPGWVSWNEVRRLYDSSSVFLFTSLRDSSSPALLEALGRGLPAVAIDHHGIADIDVGPAAIKVPLSPRPRDLPGDLAAALRAVLCDGTWEARSMAAVNWAAEQVWSVKAVAATQIYQELVGGRN